VEVEPVLLAAMLLVLEVEVEVEACSLVFLELLLIMLEVGAEKQKVQPHQAQQLAALAAAATEHIVQVGYQQHLEQLTREVGVGVDSIIFIQVQVPVGPAL
jgi:hypothetical protein